eukprot:jgi/Botrbrau1/5169/Bobra.0172s0041.1
MSGAGDRGMKYKGIRNPVDFVRWFLEGFILSKKEFFDITGIVLLMGLLYAALYLAIGSPFLPAGPAWAIALIWAVSIVCGWIFEKAHLPAALGMILSGMMLRNVGHGIAIQGLRASWSKGIRAAALAAIFLRSGLEIDLQIFKKVGWSAVRLLLVPGICEAFFDGGLAMMLFDQPAPFAFALGFILKAVGPALVIQAMFEVQQRRRGVERMVPATVVAAASFDDAIAITGYTIFINLAVSPNTSPGWSIAHGPLSLVFGIIGGAIAGIFCAFTKLWNSNTKRTAVLFIVALMMKYFFDHFNFSSAGALGAIVMGMVVKECWHRRWPGLLAEESNGCDVLRQVEKNVRFVWRAILMPALFGLVGTAINFAQIESIYIGKACAIVVAGLGVRMPVTFFVMLGSRFTLKEKIFVAFAWSPKATVQAALASSPMDQVLSVMSPTDPARPEYIQYAEEALVTAVFCIIICCSFGTLIIRSTAGFLLEKARDKEDVAMMKGPRSAPLPGIGRGGAPAGLHSHPSDTGEVELSEVSVANSDPGWQASEIVPAEQVHTVQPRARTPQATLDQLSLLSEEERERELLLARHGNAALYLESLEKAVNDIAKQQEEGGERGAPDLSEVKTNLQLLKRKLVEESKAAVGEDTVESALDFLRATGGNRAAASERALRQRHTRRPSEDTAQSSTIPFTTN